MLLHGCNHRGICETCAGALRKQARSVDCSASIATSEPSVCPFCRGPFEGLTLVNHVDENNQAARSSQDRLARMAGEAGVTLAEWQKMSPSEQQAAKHDADAKQMRAARKQLKRVHGDMDLDECQRFLIAQAGLQAELKEGRIDTTLLAEGAGDNDPLRAMLLLDVLPHSFW